MSQNKSHSNAINNAKNTLESRYGFRCKRELDIPRDNGTIGRIDCGCFHPKSPSRDECIIRNGKEFCPIGLEFESLDNKSRWVSNPQIRENSKDLRRFKEAFGGKTFHKHVSENIDWDKELGLNQQPQIQQPKQFPRPMRRFNPTIPIRPLGYKKPRRWWRR